MKECIEELAHSVQTSQQVMVRRLILVWHDDWIEKPLFPFSLQIRMTRIAATPYGCI